MGTWIWNSFARPLPQTIWSAEGPDLHYFLESREGDCQLQQEMMLGQLQNTDVGGRNLSPMHQEKRFNNALGVGVDDNRVTMSWFKPAW